MTKTAFYFFCLLVFSCSGVTAQTYAEQYKKCLQALNVTDSTPNSLPEALLGRMDSCLTGSLAPNFRSKPIAGNFIELAKLKGRVVVLNFWAIGCHPCEEEIPELNKLVKLYSTKKITFISLADDKPTSLKKFFKKHPFTFSTIADAERIMNETFKLMSIFPYAIIIDKEGRIYKMRIGGFGDVKEIVPFYKKLIDKIL